MKRQIMYIENKADLHGRGDAWIGKVEFSKTRQTVYFNNQAFKKMETGGSSGNYYDLETGNEFWISGVKKNGQDRHWSGGGKVNIDEQVIEEYLSIVNLKELDKSNFEIVNIQKTNISKFSEIENSVPGNSLKRKRKKNMKTQ
ncbi:MAG: hypothetical protein IPJ51_24645 [Saprospiraceae bacterium]|nr:hypothetical protein [Saprospiraceae bacterium]